MHSTQQLSQLQATNSHRDMTYEEMAELYAEGEWRFHQSYIPRGERDRAIYAVGFYIFKKYFGYGYEEERLELLSEWFFARRNPRKDSHRKEAMDDLRRAVFWKSSRARGLSEKTIQRLIELKTYTPRGLATGRLKQRNRARQTMVEGYAELLATGEKVGVRSMMRVTGCSHHTITKHSDIWNKEQLPSVATVITGIGVQGGEKKEALGADVVTDDPITSFFPVDEFSTKLAAKKKELSLENSEVQPVTIRIVDKRNEANLEKSDHFLPEISGVQKEPEFVVIDPKILDFDAWVIANAARLRERVFKIQQANPKMASLRGSQIISNIYRQCRGVPLA